MKTTVGVFFGGRSTEHEISVISALQAINAFNKEKYEIIPIYITKQGRWFSGDALLEVKNYRDMAALQNMCAEVYMIPEYGDYNLYRKKRALFGNNIWAKLDVVIPVLHGSNGEDGIFEGILESIGIPYAGCNTLSSANEYQGQSRIQTLRKLPWNRKWKYFRDQLLARTVVIAAIVCVVVYIAVQILAPAPGPKLYVAVFDDAVGQQGAASLQSQVAKRLDLPEGRKGGVLVDTYFSNDENGISKLQTMIANHEIDAIVATPKTFKQLSGYGYLTNLDSSLTKRQRTLLSGDFVTMKGFKDSDDPDFEGGGKGKAEPFGLSMTDFRQWNRLKSAKSNALIGIVRESPHPTTAQRLIDYLSA